MPRHRFSRHAQRCKWNYCRQYTEPVRPFCWHHWCCLPPKMRRAIAKARANGDMAEIAATMTAARIFSGEELE